MSTVTQPDSGKQPVKTRAEGWLHTRLDRALRKQLELHAVEQETSVREVVEAALRKHLGEQEKRQEGKAA